MIPTLEHVCDLDVKLSPPHELGVAPSGTKRIIPIIGGTVTGSRIKGRILDVGADWQTILTNGVADLDARYAIETDDGAVIHVTSQGVRDATADVAARIARGDVVPPSAYYMRTAIRLETGHPGYDWVNRSLFVAAGGKVGSTVRLWVYRVG